MAGVIIKKAATVKNLLIMGLPLGFELWRARRESAERDKVPTG
jgi:hypothetical protein